MTENLITPDEFDKLCDESIVLEKGAYRELYDKLKSQSIITATNAQYYVVLKSLLGQKRMALSLKKKEKPDGEKGQCADTA